MKSPAELHREQFSRQLIEKLSPHPCNNCGQPVVEVKTMSGKPLTVNARSLEEQPYDFFDGLGSVTVTPLIRKHICPATPHIPAESSTSAGVAGAPSEGEEGGPTRKDGQAGELKASVYSAPPSPSEQHGRWVGDEFFTDEDEERARAYYASRRSRVPSAAVQMDPPEPPDYPPYEGIRW